MKEKINKANNFLANKMSIIMSSMWLFWILAVVIVVAGLMQPPDTPYMFVMFVISAGFQAVALPVLAFVSNIQGERQEKVMKETHDAVMKELKLVREENAELKELLKKGGKA
jgi:membrane protein implicated in regulation of membrane protease activity